LGREGGAFPARTPLCPPRIIDMRGAILGLFLVVGLGTAGCQTVGQSRPGLSNFDTVEAGPQGLYRGAQPTPQGVLALHDQGVRSVIDLRDDPEDYEKHDVEAAGMRYVSIKTDAAKTDPAAIKAFLEAITTLPRPIYVHC